MQAGPLAAVGIFEALHGSVNSIHEPFSVFVCLLDIISVFRRLVDQKLTHIFFSLKIRIQQLQQLIHTEITLVEYAFLHGGKGIDQVRHACDRYGGVVMV